MPERVSIKRMIVTLAVSAIVVTLVIWAIAALSALVVGPVGIAEPEGSESATVTVPESEPTPTPTPEPTVSVEPTPVVSETAPEVVAPASLSGYVVCIDPGHQGRADMSEEPIGPGSSETKPKVAGGATGVSSRTPESKITLAVGLKLRDILKDKGVEVVMTRTAQDINIANSARAKKANDANADLFIRLHCDGNNDHSVHGLSTLKPARNRWTGPMVSESAKAARLVHASAISASGASDRGIVPRADMAGFNWSEVPSVIVEMGFLSNRTEDRKLNSSSYQRKLAEGMASGIVEYLKTREP